MSTQQADLDEFSKPERPSRGGFDKCDRPKCGCTTTEGTACKIPVVPGMSVCHKHLERAFDDEESNRPVWEQQSKSVG